VPAKVQMIQSLPMIGWKYSAKSMGDLVSTLNIYADRPVLDRTDLSGTYDFTLEFTPGLENADSTVERSIFAAVEQLGLKLVCVKAPTNVMVVDHAERPSGN
jgi:uncharacterized protein (TIGR03435 family)